MIPTHIYLDYNGLVFFLGFYIYIAFVKFGFRKLKRLMGT